MTERTALYRFFAADDTLLYVGITGQLSRRLGEHEDGKAWYTEIARVAVEHHPDRESALGAEKIAIRQEKPQFNIVHKARVEVRPHVRRHEVKPLPVGRNGYFDPQTLAEAIGVSRKTIHVYRTRGDIPEPDEHVGRTPLWKEETIAKWLATRPGHGWRAGQPSTGS